MSSNESDDWGDAAENEEVEATTNRRGSKRGREADCDSGAKRGRTLTGKSLKRALSRTLSNESTTPKAKRQATSEVKAKAKPKAKNKSAPSEPCIMPGCGEQRYRRLRFCSLHRYSVDNMKQQAEDENRLKTFEEGMAADASAIEVCWERMHRPQ